MKVKTSITLSSDILEAIDRHSVEFKSRSQFIETAARSFLKQLEKLEVDRRDLELINLHADELNAEADDVLDYQVSV
jgi:metal-responsive CopG/Arc/MetJ family transcriptional regulator